MPACAEDVLAFVDLVLGDLTRRDGMFFGCRADEGDGETVVIQTGEDGRYHLPLPRLGKGEGAVMATAQAHLSAVLAGRCRHAPRTDIHCDRRNNEADFPGDAQSTGGPPRLASTRRRRGHWTSLLG
jgi:hypothetical protein